MIEDEMVGWLHGLNGRESEQREAWHAAAQGSQRVGHLVTEKQ